MKLSLTHTLTFSLGTPGRAVQHLLLTALSTPQQKIERWSIDMPGFAEAATFRDGFGNKAHLVSQVKPEPELVVTVSGLVETIDKAGVLGRLDLDPPPALFRRPTDLTRPNDEFRVGLSHKDGRIALLHELMARVHAQATGPSQTQDADGQSQSQGSRPDDAVHAFIAAARAENIPARYVTGYLFDDGAARFHAWAEAWDDGLGWIGFDPLLDRCPTDHHIRLAAGLDATSTMPIRAVPMWLEMPVETVEITEA
ncbi:MAG: transglutaminase family protein [Hyphomicrobiales bacterium]|nr:MAG: transglutaminase family protein [Hyphomicrobiales bacterium]